MEKKAVMTKKVIRFLVKKSAPPEKILATPMTRVHPFEAICSRTHCNGFESTRQAFYEHGVLQASRPHLEEDRLPGAAKPGNSPGNIY